MKERSRIPLESISHSFRKNQKQISRELAACLKSLNSDMNHEDIVNLSKRLDGLVEIYSTADKNEIYNHRALNARINISCGREVFIKRKYFHLTDWLFI